MGNHKRVKLKLHKVKITLEKHKVFERKHGCKYLMKK